MIFIVHIYLKITIVEHYICSLDLTNRLNIFVGFIDSFVSLICDVVKSRVK